MHGRRRGRSVEHDDDLERNEMNMRHVGERECPRCRLIPAEVGARQNRCLECGAELVSAHSPTEAGIRAYLYEGRDTHRVPPPVTI